jgi:hypothetical protein
MRKKNRALERVRMAAARLEANFNEALFHDNIGLDRTTSVHGRRLAEDFFETTCERGLAYQKRILLKFLL